MIAEIQQHRQPLVGTEVKGESNEWTSIIWRVFWNDFPLVGQEEHKADRVFWSMGVGT